jgi:hypothetical protein
MMETLTMNRNERNRMTLMAAAGLLGLGYRQTKRVLLRCAQRYPDFGPTLAAEYLVPERKRQRPAPSLWFVLI